MTDLKNLIIDNRPQITAVIFALVVTIGGGTALAKYQQYLSDKQVARNISDAKQYMAQRREVKNQFDALGYAQFVATGQVQSQASAKICQKLDGVARKANKISEFTVEEAAKANSVVKRAQSASQKYSVEQAYNDIKNLADVCARQTSIVEFADAMNSLEEEMSPTSDEFYKKSYQITSAQADSLSKDCPYSYIHESGQKVCDNQVDMMQKYAQANKLVVDATAAGKSSTSVADKASSLYEEANKPLDSSVYKEILGEEATADNFLSKYVARIDERAHWL